MSWITPTADLENSFFPPPFLITASTELEWESQTQQPCPIEEQ